MPAGNTLRKAIIIMTDTQRSDMLGCYGNPGMKTPCLDRLAGEGVRFERAYTCQPVCGPARAALFTGTYPHSSGCWGNSMPLGDNVRTLGQRLSDQGLRTAYVGKWHLDGSDYFGLGRCPAGWDPDYWYDMRNYLEELSSEDRIRSRRKETILEDIEDGFTFGHRCSNRAIDFLEKHGDDDFLLVVSYDEPHDPHLCPRRFYDMYEGYEFPVSANVKDSLEEKPEHQQVWAEGGHREDRSKVRISPQAFLGCNSFVDYEIGRVLEAIDAHAPEALVIYTSDHGSALQSHCLEGKGPAMYDEIARIPFIVRHPNTAGGQVCPHPTSHIDVVPTVMEHLGVSLPEILEGSSMLPAIASPEVRINDKIFMEFGRYEIDHDGFGGFQPIRACFDGRYKLSINLMTSDELYDMENDPQELCNLITNSEHTAVRNKLHDAILAWMNETRDPFRGYYWERRPWRDDAREATWSYTGMTRQRLDEDYEPRQLDYRTGLPIKEATRPK